MVQHCDIEEYLDALQSSRKFGPQVVCSKAFPRRDASYAKPRHKLDRRLLDGLARLGIKRLYTHQAEALDIIEQGTDVLVATPTASGKSLIYNLPVMDSYLRQSHSRYLYLFPSKSTRPGPAPHAAETLCCGHRVSRRAGHIQRHIRRGHLRLSENKNQENGPERPDHQS